MSGDLLTYARVACATALGLAALAVFLAFGARRGGGPGWGAGRGDRLERLLHPVWTRAAEGGAGPLAQDARLPAAPLWAVAGFGVGLALFRGLVPAFLVAVSAVWVVEARLRAKRRDLTLRLQAGLEAALETLVASLKAGRGLLEALDHAAGQSPQPFREALGTALAAHRAGGDLGEAVAGMGRDWPLPEAAYLGACLKVHSQTGGDVTALLINLGGMLRERNHLGRELGAKTNEARATATLLSLLTPALLAYILWAQPAQLGSLVATPFGAGAAAYAAGSWLVGVFVVGRMLRGLRRDIDA